MRKKIKNKIVIYLTFLIILSLLTIIYALLVYTNKVNTTMKSYHTVTFIIGIVSFFLLGFVTANLAGKNGLMEGLVAALIIILIVLLVNLIIKVDFNFKTLVKTVTYLLSSCLGGVIGVNFRPFSKRSLH